MDKVSNPRLVAPLVSQALVLVPELCKGTPRSKAGLPGRKLGWDEPMLNVVYRNISPDSTGTVHYYGFNFEYLNYSNFFVWSKAGT